MKKLILSLATVALMLAAVPANAITDSPAPITTPANAAEINVLISRIDEIMAMDRSAMSHSEKKEIREEVREIKDELKKLDSNVTMSVGAVIIIVLLLILLL